MANYESNVYDKRGRILEKHHGDGSITFYSYQGGNVQKVRKSPEQLKRMRTLRMVKNVAIAVLLVAGVIYYNIDPSGAIIIFSVVIGVIVSIAIMPGLIRVGNKAQKSMAEGIFGPFLDNFF